MNYKNILQLALLLLLPLLAFCKEEDNGEILVFVVEGSKDEDYASAINTFEKYSIKYKTVFIKKSGISDAELEKHLYNEVNGEKMAKYKVLVFPNGRVSYDRAKNSRSEDGDWQSALKYDQWEKFYDYSRSFNTRLVFLNEYPSNYTSTSLVQEYKGEEAKRKYQTKQIIIPEEGISEEKTIRDIKLTTEGIYHFPAKIIEYGNGVKAEPLLYFEKNEDFPEQSIAAVSVDNNGAQYVAFFMAFGQWSKDSTALNIVWLNWAAEKDFKLLSGNQKSTEDALKDSGALGFSKVEIFLGIVAAIVPLLITLF